MPQKHKPKKIGKTHKPKDRNPENKQSVAILHKMRYSWRWQKLSKRMRAHFLMCQDKNCDQIAVTVHHIKRGEAYPELFYVMHNLIPLCDHHHACVSQMERTGNFSKAESLYDYWSDIIEDYYLSQYTNTEEHLNDDR